MAEQPKAPPAPPRRSAPPPPAPPPVAPGGAGGQFHKNFTVSSGVIQRAKRILIYGPGGVGKSSLAALAPRPVFGDIEKGTYHLDVARVDDIETWTDLRSFIQSPVVEQYQTIVIDTATKAEDWALKHVLETVKVDNRGEVATTIESYGWGRGYQHVYDVFMLLLSDLDRQVTAGRNVILIAHECTANVPNPSGEDFIRYEPHLQTNKNGKASIRNRVFQWADYVLFVGYDVDVQKDGKGRGAGTRTIWLSELPTHMAKGRVEKDRDVSISRPYTGASDGTVWNEIFNGGAK